MNKNIKIIIISLILIALSAVAVFFFFFNKTDSPAIADDDSVFFPINEAGRIDLGDDFRRTQDGGATTFDNVELPALRQITRAPVAGMTIFTNELAVEETDLVVEENLEIDLIRYIEKATGHIYEIGANSVVPTRISNTTIPKIHEAIWLNENNLIIRYLDEQIIKTFSAELVAIADASTEKELQGVFLRDNLKEIIKFGKKLFYLMEMENFSTGILSDWDGENQTEIFSSPLKEWLLSEIDDKQIAFSSKTSELSSGFLFIFNSQTDKFEELLTEKLNLSALVASNSNVLYSENSGIKPVLFLYDKQSGISAELGFVSFPEKCVWSEDNLSIYCAVPRGILSKSSLDEWRKGKISFTDDIWKIDVATLATTLLISPTEELGVALDIIKPMVNSAENYLVFINKKDYSLWGLRLSPLR